MRVRVLLAAVAALLTLAMAPAPAEGAGYRAQTLHFIVHFGPGKQTECKIGALYTPARASKQHPVPAIMTANGFGGSYRDQIPLAKNIASDGFVVLTYSGLGPGGSSCRISMYSPRWDGEAASRLITFLGGGSAATNGPCPSVPSRIRMATRTLAVACIVSADLTSPERPDRSLGRHRRPGSTPATPRGTALLRATDDGSWCRR
jgi:hypothetical protein